MKNLIKRIFSSLILLIILFCSFTNIILISFFLIVLSFLTLKELNIMYDIIFKKEKFSYFIFFLISLIYITIFSMLTFIHLSPMESKNILSIIFILMICSLTDIGGYIIGNIIGGKKLTKISPKKTYSGVLGSFLFPLIFCSLFFKFFNHLFVFDINLFILIILVSLITQMGDLIISFLKRKANLKDTGTLLPGHGGVLDRIDGILFGLPIGIMLISI